jgi:hypothetical protein
MEAVVEEAVRLVIMVPKPTLAVGEVVLCPGLVFRLTPYQQR